MKIEVQKYFEKDISKIRDKKLAEQIFAIIEELENCNSLSEIRHVKKMTSTSSYYRIRVGNYRLGFKESKGSILLLRFMHRKDIYEYFP